jgi:hypothetical protein
VLLLKYEGSSLWFSSSQDPEEGLQSLWRGIYPGQYLELSLVFLVHPFDFVAFTDDNIYLRCRISDNSCVSKITYYCFHCGVLCSKTMRFLLVAYECRNFNGWERGDNKLEQSPSDMASGPNATCGES